MIERFPRHLDYHREIQDLLHHYTHSKEPEITTSQIQKGRSCKRRRIDRGTFVQEDFSTKARNFCAATAGAMRSLVSSVISRRPLAWKELFS